MNYVGAVNGVVNGGDSHVGGGGKMVKVIQSGLVMKAVM